MSATGLKEVIESQKEQLDNYEKKLKDVVHAYKSLQTEKKALEVALETLSDENNGGQTGQVERVDEIDGLSTIDSLKQALKTLMVESKRKELAFQNDRKLLLSKNEKNVHNLEAKYQQTIAGIEAEKERMIADHGAVLATMQARYADEFAKAKQRDKTITELYTQIHLKDQKIQSDSAIVSKFEKLQDEMLRWKKRAQQTPRENVLIQEIENLKKNNTEELNLERNRQTLNKDADAARELRVSELETRLTEISRKNAEYEVHRAELANRIVELENRIAQLNTPSEAILTNTADNASDSSVKKSKLLFVKIYKKLKETDGFDVFEVLNIDPPRHFDNPSQSSGNRVENDNCLKCCILSENLEHCKGLISHLQKQLSAFEGAQEAAKSAHEEMANALRQRISELEANHAKVLSDINDQTNTKVAELESEIQKQRSRMQQIILEKDGEIEAARLTLPKVIVPDPVDPPQLKALENSLLPQLESDSIVGNHVPQPDVSKNVFYEQEMSRYEAEITEIRSRDVEQSTLTKDIQYLEIIETLKEEVRILEGRLQLQSTVTNVEYLRNIFVQCIGTKNPEARRHIWRAIGSVLKLTPQEMRQLDDIR